MVGIENLKKRKDNKMNKNIGIDYDDTISLNIDMWKSIIKIFNSFNFNVYVVTYRDSSQFEDIYRFSFVKDYIYTSGKGKKQYCKDMGVEIDIWIDDCPESILYDYKELISKI